MPSYQYSAVDGQGKKLNGILEADSARQTRQMLRDDGLIPSTVELITQEESTPHAYFWSRQFSSYDLTVVTRQLAVLLQAAIPLEEAMHTIGRQHSKPHIKRILSRVRSQILEGRSLSQAFARSGRFPSLYLSTIASGERSGSLDRVLEKLADYLENRYTLQKTIQSAMIYPIVLAVIAMAIIMGLMTFVVPQIVTVIQSSEQAVPTITRVMMAISTFIREQWYVLVVVIVAVTIVMRRFLRTRTGHYWLDGLILKLPVIKTLSRNINASRFASTLSILTQSAVPLVEALGIAADIATNVYMRDAILAARNKVVEGGNLAYQLERSQLFPLMMVQMIHSGERSGELDVMLQKAADMQDREVSTTISMLLAILEPLMLVVMAMVVGLIILSVMLPILNMNNLIQ